MSISDSVRANLIRRSGHINRYAQQGMDLVALSPAILHLPPQVRFLCRSKFGRPALPTSPHYYYFDGTGGKIGAGAGAALGLLGFAFPDKKLVYQRPLIAKANDSPSPGGSADSRAMEAARTHLLGWSSTHTQSSAPKRRRLRPLVTRVRRRARNWRRSMEGESSESWGRRSAERSSASLYTLGRPWVWSG